MRDQDKTKKELANELNHLRHRLNELQKALDSRESATRNAMEYLFDRADSMPAEPPEEKTWEKAVDDLESRPAGGIERLDQLSEALRRETGQRQCAEQDLADTRALLLAVIQQSFDGIVLADAPNAKIHAFNSVALGIREHDTLPVTGVAAHEHTENWQMFRPNGTALTHEESPLTEAVRYGKTSTNVEMIIRRPSGDDRWVLANAAPVWNARGQIRAGVMTFHDITDRKRTKAELAESEERYRLLTQNSSTGIYILLDSAFVYANRRLTEILGYPMEELLGKKFWEFAHPDDVETVIERCRAKHLGTEEPPQYEFRVVCKHGEIKWLETFVSRIPYGGRIATMGNVTDVTESKKAEDALREHEQMLKTILSASPVAISYLEGGRLKWTNEAMAKMFGYDFEHEYLGKMARDFYSSRKEYERVLGIFKKALSEGSLVETEAQFVRKDGSVFDGQMSISSVDTSASNRGVISTIADISERKRAAANLESELRKFRALYDLAVAMTVEQSLDSNLSFVAVMSRTLLDTDASLVAVREEKQEDVYVVTTSGMRDDKLRLARIPLEQGLELKSAHMRPGLILEDNLQEIDPRLREVVQEEGLVSGLAAPIRMGQSNLGVLYAFNRNETTFSRSHLETLSLLANLGAVEIARKRAEEMLRKSEEGFRELYEESERSKRLYRSLLDSSPDAVVVYDLDGKVRYVNDSFSRTFGWTSEEVKGVPVPFLPDSERGPTEAVIERVIEHGITVSGFKTKRYTKDGSLLEISASASLYHDHEGNPAGMLVILSDITEQRRLEEQLRQAVKMEAIGRLAGGVAHDFNNLLTAIIGYSDVLLHQMPQGSLHREKILQISSTARRAASLTGQLLAFSRKQVLEVKVLDINAVIAGMEEMVRRLIGEDIELITVLDPSLEKVEADGSQIEQILMNLVVNARDAMPEGGSITIETANVRLDEDYVRSRAEVAPGPYVMVAVTDAGHGMDTATMSRVFDPFFTTKDKGKGTGLGLSTAYGIVKQHRGHIAVYSEPDRGTIFKVYLPRAKAHSEETSVPQVVYRECRGRETVLLVEDEDLVRNLATEVLEMLGYAVISASDPEEALKASEQYDGFIHLLLTDVVLPQMDGTRLFKRLSVVRPEMKVLYVSGYTQNFISQHGVLRAGVHFLQKPFSVETLSRKVRQVLDHT